MLKKNKITLMFKIEIRKVFAQVEFGFGLVFWVKLRGSIGRHWNEVYGTLSNRI